MALNNKLVPLIGVVALALGGCVSVPQPDPNDPLESYNRSMFQINEAVDGAVIKPVATAYDTLVPEPVTTCVGNIFGNLGDIWSGFNSMLQGRGLDAVNTFGRVLFNTTMGLGGCIDVASMNGAEKIPNDFGTTLAVWGVKQGDYLVLPVLGPSTFRDTAGTVVNSVGKHAAHIAPSSIDNVRLRNPIIVVDALDTRIKFFEAEALVDDIALDKYSFIRDAYLQNRQALVASKREPEIRDGTKVLKWQAEDDKLYGPGEDLFRRPAEPVYKLTVDDMYEAAPAPSYDDPDLPVYDDPEE